MKYYIEDTLYQTRSPKLIRQEEGKLLEKYDYDLKKWVTDTTLTGIYFGEILVNDATEEEINDIIKNAK